MNIGRNNSYLVFSGCHLSPEVAHLHRLLWVLHHWHGLVVQKLIGQLVMLLWPLVGKQVGIPNEKKAELQLHVFEMWSSTHSFFFCCAPVIQDDSSYT